MAYQPLVGYLMLRFDLFVGFICLMAYQPLMGYLMLWFDLFVGFV